MSALSIYPELDQPTVSRPALRVVEPPRPVARPVRLTRRGRTLVTLAFLGLLLAAMIPLGGWATATLSGGTPAPVRIVEVRPGQTLYDIAGTVAKPGQVQEMIYRIEQLNSLSSPTILEGQKLAVPRG